MRSNSWLTWKLIFSQWRMSSKKALTSTPKSMWLLETACRITNSLKSESQAYTIWTSSRSLPISKRQSPSSKRWPKRKSSKMKQPLCSHQPSRRRTLFSASSSLWSSRTRLLRFNRSTSRRTSLISSLTDSTSSKDCKMCSTPAKTPQLTYTYPSSASSTSTTASSTTKTIWSTWRRSSKTSLTNSTSSSF